MNKTQINALKRIIAGAKSFPSLQGVFINADKRYCFCNSFMLVCLINEPPAEFPHVVGIDTERAMARHISHMPGKRLYPDLSKACELSKAKASYDFGKGLPAINPKYLSRGKRCTK